MATQYGPRIITDGLVCALDAADKNSYPGTGNVWTDLTGNSNNGTLFLSPSYSTAFGGVFTFDGSTQYITVSGLNYSIGTSTVFCASRYSGATRGRMVNGTSNNWLIGQWGGSTENYYAEGWVSTVSSGAGDTVWRIYAACGNSTTDSYQVYVNGSLTFDSNGGSQGPNGLTIGRYGQGTSEWTTGQVSFVYVYNRVLNRSEVSQNFNALRGRFGI